MKKAALIVFSFFFISFLTHTTLLAQSEVNVNAGADLVSRYVWRGMDFGKSPAIQPTLDVSYYGVQLGVWGSYTLNETASGSDELDTWISYTYSGSDLSVSAIITDYYFPNNGIKFGNLNNHDDEDGPGAHTFEAGISIDPVKLPFVISAFYNFYNDAGNNTYFQVDFPFNVKEYEMNAFIGATAGSEDNPDYYGAEEFSVINLGIKAQKELKITDGVKLPVYVMYVNNPKAEISHLVFGISI